MGKRIRIVSFSVAAFVALILMVGTQASAAIISTNDYQLTGKVEAKAAFFTNDASGNTGLDSAAPQGFHYKAWDMFKERNMGYLEWTHDLSNITGMDLQYHIVGRVMYEGVYDYGPSVFRAAYEANKAAFDRYNLRFQGGIWEAYANFKSGPFNLRVGRQNLSWGNTDIIRVIDHINPLDNTWGGTGTESLDDRRIPLWMIRLGYQASTTFGLEGYLVPGAIDATVGPVAPYGSAYNAPNPNLDGLTALYVTPGFNNEAGALTEPERTMSSSRVGIKLLLPGLLGGNNSNVELSYQRTYWDSIALRFKTNGGVLGHDPIGVFAGNPGTLAIEFIVPKVNIFGVSWNYVFQDLDFIFKGDLAHVQGAPVYIKDINQPMPSYLISTGEFTYRDFTNIGLSFEKNIWIRWINPGEKVQFLFEYYGNYCHDWDDRMIVPVADPGNLEGGATGTDPNQKRFEQTLALSVTSEYHMKTKVNIATLYFAQGTWMIIPTVTYRFNNPLTLAVGYSCTFGNWIGASMDRDQVNVMLKYEF